MRRNGMGPDDQGPMTGRGLGNCSPKENVDNRDELTAEDLRRGQGFLSGGRGRGFGSRRGRGPGMKRRGDSGRGMRAGGRR